MPSLHPRTAAVRRAALLAAAAAATAARAKAALGAVAASSSSSASADSAAAALPFTASASAASASTSVAAASSPSVAASASNAATAIDLNGGRGAADAGAAMGRRRTQAQAAEAAAAAEGGMEFEARSAEDLVYGLLESSPSSSTSSGWGFLAPLAASSSSSSSAGLRIEIRAASASGHSCTSHFSNGESLAPILPEDGAILSTGDPLRFDARRTSNSVADGWGDARSTNWLLGGDPDLDAAVGGTNPAGATREATRDACRLEFEFRCVADEGSGEGRRAAYVGLEYVFASEEYYEHLGTPYGDVFAVSLNGENAASLPSGAAVGIDTVNPTTNGEYFVGNDATGDEGAIYPSVEADGLTAPLAARGEVTVGEWNAMKIAIADVGDGMLDSWLLLRDGSLRCEAKGKVQEPIPRESNVQESAVEPLAMRPPRDVPPRPPSDIVDLAHSSGVESLGIWWNLSFFVRS